MKFFHLSDLHFGKQLHGYDLTEEHREFIRQVAEYAKEEEPDAILISGDIYDKSVPSATAMTLLDEFLNSISGIPILIIAGNHDSAERLRYAQSFFERHNIYISVMPPQSEEEHLKKVTLNDEFGQVNFYMMPFIKPGMVRHFMSEEAAAGEESVIRKLLDREQIDHSMRNVILSHQFYINGGSTPKLCDSEQATTVVGGLDSVDIAVLDGFEYAALGHIHGSQNMGGETRRYCGTPLKFSVSEANHHKSITVVTMAAKGETPVVRTLPVTQRRDVRKLKGHFVDIISEASDENREDYVSITLTDEDIPEQVKDQLSAYYDNILEVIVDNTRTRKVLEEEIPDIKEMSPYDAFSSFFKEISGRDMNDAESGLLCEILEEVKGEER